jgi:hypothetical protein
MHFSREAAKNAKMSEFHRRRNFLKRRLGKAIKSFSFAFFAASREENLLSKFAPNCGYTQQLISVGAFSVPVTIHTVPGP